MMLADNARLTVGSPGIPLAEPGCLPLPYPVSVDIADNRCRVFVECGLALRGEFSGCDHLAIAGHVESDVALRVIDILARGSFKGSASVDEAHVAGRYEGVLTVAGTLVVGSAAYISGSVQCDKLQLEEGGKIEGDLRILSEEAEKAAKRDDDAMFQTPAVEPSPGAKSEVDEPAVERRDTPTASDAVDVMLVAAAAAADDALVAKAEATFRAALKANPFDVTALSGLGHLARQRGDLAGALDYFKQIIAADGENISVRRVSVEILTALSRHEEAAVLAQEVRAFGSQNSPADGDDAPDERASLPNFDEAEAMFKSVLDRHPKNLGALAGLGHLARRRGDTLAMLKYYTAALALEPTNVTLRVEVARAVKEQGEVVLARQILETVLAENRGSQAAC